MSGIRKELLLSKAEVQDLRAENSRLKTQVGQLLIERAISRSLTQSGSFQLFQVENSSEKSQLAEYLTNDKCSHVIVLNRAESTVKLRAKKSKPVARVKSQPIMPSTSDSDEPDLT